MSDLFDGAYPDPPEPQRPARRTYRELRAERLALGVHPLNGEPLRGDGETCGTCVHRVFRVRSRRFPKCDLGPVTGGPATDVLASWPACIRWEVKP